MKKMRFTNYFILSLLIFIPLKLSKYTFVSDNKNNFISVKVTMYSIDPRQTDDTPLETASGFIVDSLNPKKHRIIAVSHDLKKQMRWGQKVMVTGIGKYSGIYYVKDLMNKRYRKMIDILINPTEKAITFNSAKLFKL